MQYDAIISVSPGPISASSKIVEKMEEMRFLAFASLAQSSMLNFPSKVQCYAEHVIYAYFSITVYVSVRQPHNRIAVIAVF